MSQEIRCNITRSNTATPIAKNIVMQFDEMGAQEASGYQGAEPHFTYKVQTTLLPLRDPQFVRFRDHLIDQDTIDIVTNRLRVYLIVSDPVLHTLNGHWEMVVTRYRGG